MLAVTGNISWEETVRLTEKWFAPIPRRNVPDVYKRQESDRMLELAFSEQSLEVQRAVVMEEFRCV